MNRSTSRTTRHAFAAAAAACVLLLGLTGCGDDTEPTASDPASGETSTDASDPTATTTPPTTAPTTPETTAPTKPPVVLPDCEEVWAGETLPFGYRGCMEGDTVVKAMPYPCSSGGRLIAYRNHYAIAGRVINDTDGPATDDRAYGRAIQGCSA